MSVLVKAGASSASVFPCLCLLATVNGTATRGVTGREAVLCLIFLRTGTLFLL